MSTILRGQHATLPAIVVSAVLLPACAPIAAEQPKLQAPPPASTTSSGSELIEGYKGWTRVNAEPALFRAPTAILCAPLTAQEMADPHRDKFITVYVNDTGRKAMMHEKNPRFPQGSVIVKEKLPYKESKSPELLTVMIKREAGYNPETGDWEFMATNGTGKEVQERGRLEKCQSCHMMEKDTDYVARTYLSQELRKKLK